MNPGELLIAYLAKEGITLKRFASRCGLSRRTIYDVLQGKRKMHYTTIIKIKTASKGELNFSD